MRAFLALLILCAATADAQPSAEAQVPPEASLTAPPITSAPREVPPPAPPPSATPEEEFIMPSFPSTPAQEQAPAPPPAPRADPTPPAPAKSSVAPAQRQPSAPSPPRATSPKSSDLSVLEIVTIPIGAGLVVGGVASRITSDRTTLIYLTLGTVGVATLAMITTVVYVAIRGNPEESASNSFKVVPVPVVVSAGRDNAGIAAGPGLFLRF